MIHLQKSKISRINLIKKAEKYVKKHSTLEKNWYYSSAFAQPALTFPAATTRTGYLSTIASYNENSLGHLYGSGPVEILAKSKLRHQPPRTETCTKAILQIQCIFCNTPALGIATMNNPPIYRTTAASSSQATITSRQRVWHYHIADGIGRPTLPARQTYLARMIMQIKRGNWEPTHPTAPFSNFLRSKSRWSVEASENRTPGRSYHYHS